MGTFHHDRGELHGITVLVDTGGPETWVGRCDTIEGGHIVLLGAERHSTEEDALDRRAFLRRVSMAGPFPNFDRVVLPLGEAARVQPLASLDPSAPD